MSVFGVTSNGFVAKTIGAIVSSLNSGYRAVYGLGVNLDPSSRIGQKIGLFAGSLSEVWELGEALYNAGDPANATGAGLDNQLKIVGLARKGAIASTVTLTLTGTPTTVVAAGKQVSVVGTSNKFATDGSATIASVSAWAGSTGYSLSARVANGGNVYQATTAGTSDSSGGPTGTSDSITDGTVVWRFLGAGAGAVDQTSTAIVTGPIVAFSGSATVIETPVSGWSGVINVLDAAVGQLSEQDPAARGRRDASFQKAAESPLGAIRAAIFEVPGVTTCAIFENTSDSTIDSQPPHSFEALVEGGDDTAIGNAIFANCPGGIQSYGNVILSVNDSQGGAHAIGFSRPVEVDIYVDLTLTYEPLPYPIDGDTQVTDQLVLDGNARAVGRDVVASQISAGVFIENIGVIDVSLVKISTSPSPSSSAPIVVTPRQKAKYDSSRVVIHSTPGTP